MARRNVVNVRSDRGGDMSNLNSSAVRRLRVAGAAIALAGATLLVGAGVAGAGGPDFTFIPPNCNFEAAVGHTDSCEFTFMNWTHETSRGIRDAVHPPGPCVSCMYISHDTCDKTRLGPRMSCSITVVFRPRVPNAEYVGELLADTGMGGAHARLVGYSRA
jgi:hypothetical protein